MSLINEALKKAQKQRTGESPSLSAAPSIGGERPDQIARRGKSTGIGEFLLPLGLGFVGLAVLVVGAVFLFRSKGDDAPAKPVAIANPPPAAKPAAPTAAPVESAPPPIVATTPAPEVSAPQPAPVAPAVSSFTVPNVAATTPTKPSSTATETIPPAAPVITLTAPPPATPAPPAPTPAASVGPLKLEPRAINFIEGLRVTGIRVSGTDPKDSKVLMNDRVYRLGSLVDAEMGLRLVGIAAVSLTFEDERGARYTRLFN